MIEDLNVEKIIGTLYEKKLQKINRKKFSIEKVIKRNGNKLYLKWKGYDNSFNNWIDKKKYCYIEMSYFSKPHTNKNKIEVGLHFSNYLTKSDLKKQKPLIHQSLLKKLI